MSNYNIVTSEEFSITKSEGVITFNLPTIELVKNIPENFIDNAAAALNLLERLGIVTIDEDGDVVILNEDYPVELWNFLLTLFLKYSEQHGENTGEKIFSLLSGFRPFKDILEVIALFIQDPSRESEIDLELQAIGTKMEQLLQVGLDSESILSRF